MTETERAPHTPAANQRPYGLRLALFAGLLLWLSHPAPALWPIAWFGIVPLITGVTRAVRLRQAVWRGYIFGWVYLGLVWYWTGLTIVAWTHSIIGWAAWFGLTLILASFYALWAGVIWTISRKATGWAKLLGVSAAWVVMEWLRTFGKLGMPWAQISYSQVSVLPMVQIAEITGAYGVTFVLCLFNTALADWWTDRTSKQTRIRLRVAACVALLTWLYGAIRLSVPDRGPQLEVAAMQPNFRSLGDSNTFRDMLVFQNLTRATVETQKKRNVAAIELFVWPESAAPQDAIHDYQTYMLLRDLTQEYDTALSTGSRVVEPGVHAEYNSSVLIDREGAVTRYDKRQLVPFGEFIPYRETLPSFLDEIFQFPQFDVSPGKGGAHPLVFRSRSGDTVALGPFICYESVYPTYARDMAYAGANLLVTQSNDDWFQSSAAMDQHLSAVIMRAIENRRTVVRSTTTGITCIIDSRGHIIGRVPRYTQTAVVGKVTLNSLLTIYTRFGDWFVWLNLAVLAAILYRGRKAMVGGDDEGSKKQESKA